MPSVYGNLHGTLQQVLFQQMGWSELREVQERAYAAVSSGRDALITAPTAGGKSEAALIPVMDGILKHGHPGVSCLYLSPLKALINDQEERFSSFCSPAGLSVLKWHGDVPKGDRAWKEGEPPHILLITPESLEILLMEKTIAPDLARLKYVIVDEVHAFADTERGTQLICLLDRIDRLAGRPVQLIGLSATVGNPGDVLEWLAGSRRERVVVEVPAPPKEKRFTFTVEPDEGRRMAAVSRIVAGKKALVFVNSRADAERVAKALKGKVAHLSVHHSSLSPELRKAAESVIAGDDGGCIICTSTLELGIDIGDLDIVVQVGPPNSVSSFLQRMGRSGRRKRAAFVAWVLKDPSDFLFSVAVVECAAQKRVEPLTPPRVPYNVLLQQMFIAIQKAGRCSRRQLEREVLDARPFRGISREIFDTLLSHLVSEGYFVTDGDMLMAGGRAESEFGRSNWKDIYSVIAGGGEYRAVTPDGTVVGTLDARFVASRGADDFTLGGASWRMVKCDDAHGIVVVVPGPGQKSRVFWTGGEAGFSSLICAGVQGIVATGTSTLPLTEKDGSVLREAMASFPPGIRRGTLLVTEQKTEAGAEVLVFSFRGQKFNRVLAALLTRELSGRAQARFHDLAVIVRNAGKTGVESTTAALERIRSYDAGKIGDALTLPPRDAWKFARALPEAMFREMVLTDYFRVTDFREAMGDLGISGGERQSDPTRVGDPQFRGTGE
jgi:ATP-dependent Lhr-like helicase